MNNFNFSLLLATKVEITQARQDITAVHGNPNKQRVFFDIAAFHFLGISHFHQWQQSGKEDSVVEQKWTLLLFFSQRLTISNDLPNAV